MNEIKRADVGFAQVKNEVLFDPNLSFKAKGVFAYIYAKPSNWQFSGDRIVKESRDGRKAIYACLKELEDCGYLVREKLSDGRVVYHLSYEKSPVAQNGQEVEKPVAQKGKEPKRQRAKRGSIYNKENSIQTQIEHNNTELATLSIADKEKAKAINDVLGAFQMKLNPNINFGNKTQRGAAQFLIQQVGVDRVLKAIDYCLQIQGDQFSPTVTTPYQLKEKWAQIAAYHKKQSHNQNRVAVIS